MKPCGTNAAYGRHFRNRETACGPCRDARSGYIRERYARRGVDVDVRVPTSSKVAEFLDMHGEATMRELSDRFPRVKVATMRRAVVRMVADGRVVMFVASDGWGVWPSAVRFTYGLGDG